MWGKSEADWCKSLHRNAKVDRLASAFEKQFGELRGAPRRIRSILALVLVLDRALIVGAPVAVLKPALVEILEH